MRCCASQLLIDGPLGGYYLSVRAPHCKECRRVCGWYTELRGVLAEVQGPLDVHDRYPDVRITTYRSIGHVPLLLFLMLDFVARTARCSLPDEATDESAKQLFETPDDLLLDLEERDFGVQLPLEARHPVLPDTTRRYAFEPREVSLYVQREAVGGNAPAGELHPDGGNLAAVHPHARVLRVPYRFEPVVREDKDDQLFQIPQVLVGVELFEAQNGIPHQLSGAVEGCVPTPVAPEHLRPQRLQVLLPRPEIRGVPGRAANGVDRRVLQEDEGVWNLIPLAQPDELPLQLPPLRVRRQAGEAANVEDRLGRALPKLHVFEVSRLRHWRCGRPPSARGHGRSS